MKNLRIKHIVLVYVGILMGFLLGYLVFKQTEVEVPKSIELPTQVQQSINVMNNKLDSIQAENAILLQKNDSIKVRIIKIKEDHEETSRIILANDVESDYLFFSDYIGYFDAAYGFMYYDYDASVESGESNL